MTVETTTIAGVVLVLGLLAPHRIASAQQIDRIDATIQEFEWKLKGAAETRAGLTIIRRTGGGDVFFVFSKLGDGSTPQITLQRVGDPANTTRSCRPSPDAPAADMSFTLEVYAAKVLGDDSDPPSPIGRPPLQTMDKLFVWGYATAIIAGPRRAGFFSQIVMPGATYRLTDNGTIQTFVPDLRNQKEKEQGKVKTERVLPQFDGNDPYSFQAQFIDKATGAERGSVMIDIVRLTNLRATDPSKNEGLRLPGPGNKMATLDETDKIVYDTPFKVYWAVDCDFSGGTDSYLFEVDWRATMSIELFGTTELATLGKVTNPAATVSSPPPVPNPPEVYTQALLGAIQNSFGWDSSGGLHRSFISQPP